MTRTNHGRSRDPLHVVWRMMIARCHNPKAQAYPSYGARGITVCARWRESFDAFEADVGAKPTPKHEIDRIDNDAGYSPENCRWATRSENDRNRRSTVWVDFGGERRRLIELCEEFGVRSDTVRERIKRGWAVELAVRTPTLPRAPRGQKSPGTYSGPGAEVFAAHRAASKRRAPKGAEHAHAKLDESKVVAIRERFAAGETKASLARAFGVSEPGVWCVVNRVSWKHVA